MVKIVVFASEQSMTQIVWFTANEQSMVKIHNCFIYKRIEHGEDCFIYKRTEHGEDS